MTSSKNRTPGKSQLLEDTLELNQTLLQSRSHLIWGCLNVIAVSALVYNLIGVTRDSTVTSKVIYYGLVALTAILAINSIFHILKYSIITFSVHTVCLSPSQKKLMGINLSDRYLKSPEKPLLPAASPPKPEFTATSPMNLSTSNWLFPVNVENTPPNSNYSMRTDSWVYHLPTTPQSTYQPFCSPGEDFIRDETSLTRYLEEAEEMEKKAAVSMSVEQPASVLSSFWNSPVPKVTNDVSPLLRRCAYQMSTISPVVPSSSPGTAADEGGSPLAGLNNIELWRRVNVDPNRLIQWNANLRMWISLTILQRLVKELDFIDEAFLRCGLSDLHLGSVGLDRLKKTASIPQVVASIPSLPRLVPFLELSPHQEYLVTRIRELAKGGSMSEFRWLSGGSLNGKSWEEHLPTDAALIMHLIATYLDLQLLPLPHRPDTRPFSSQYFVRSPEKPPRGGSAPIIYQSQLNPPHFMIVDKDEILDIPKGRNNVFHMFLLFLHILKTREHGMLGPVNLGRSGVNVLWVIDS